MCGRTFCAIDPRCIQKSCEYIDPQSGEPVCPSWVDAPTGDGYSPSYNTAPTTFTPVLIAGEHSPDKVHQRVIQPMRWGLVPQWHKGNRASFKTMHNNCRGETITEKSTFATPFAKGKRCVVLAEGFFEWKTVGSKKTPYLFTAKGPLIKAEHSETYEKEKIKVEQPEPDIIKADIKTEEGSAQPAPGHTKESSKTNLLFMAGVFDICKEEGGPLYSYSILTTQSTGAVAEIHHRMPVLLESELDIERWLNYQQYPSSKVKDLICARDCLNSQQVSDKVNNVRYREADCVLPVCSTKSGKLAKGDIRNFFAKPDRTKRKPEPSEDSTSKHVKKELVS